MKRLIRSCLLMGMMLVLLLAMNKWLFSFHKGELYGLWALNGLGLSIQAELKNEIKSEDSELKAELLSMLKNSEHNSINQNIAIDLSALLKDDPEIRQQLLVLSNNHPDEFVRCVLQNTTVTGVEITIISGEGDNQVASTFVDIPQQECQPE